MNLILNDKEAYNKISKSYEEQKGKEFGLQAFIRVIILLGKTSLKNI